MTNNTLGFIGAGRMATAMARGFITAGLTTADRIVASDPHPAALAHFLEVTGGQPAGSNWQVAEKASMLFLAVKPQQMAQVLFDLKGHVTSDHLVVSIAAGIPLATLSKAISGGANSSKPRLIRVMPNTPCLVGKGASCYCLGPGATGEDGQIVGRLLSAVGTAIQVDEKLLDAVTGLSGSGPAFVYVMIEALSDGGVRMGLPRDVALKLAAQTVAGAAEMVLNTGEHPAVLKDQVTSPGGTTIAGIHALETGGLRAALMSAVEAATRRSTELGIPA